MGNQVNFFLSNDDHGRLIRKLLDFRPISYVLPPLASSDFVTFNIDSLENWAPGEHSPLLFLGEHKSMIKLRLGGPKQASHFVDVEDSPVIEYRRAIQCDSEILRGRLYYTTRYIDADDCIHSKPQEFLEFAKRVFGIAKNFCKDRHEGFYVGPGAAILQSKGFKLALN